MFILQKKFPLISSCLFIFCLLFIIRNVCFSLDPDVGWHIRMGEIILFHGIPLKDVFSYTMPSYTFIDHEWLSDIFIATLYPILGLIGLSILFTLLAYTSLLLQLFTIKKKWIAVPLFLCMGGILDYLGIRPQIFSWLFFSILILIIRNEKRWNVFRFFTPLLFLLWANMHGSFALGLIILAVSVLLNFYTRRRFSFVDGSIVIVSILITLCNPYGCSLWWETWTTFTSSSLRMSIHEWQPAFFSLNFGLVFLLPISAFFVFKTKKYLLTRDLVLFVILLTIGLSSVKNIPYFLILALPMTVTSIAYFVHDIQRLPQAQSRFSKAYLCYFAFVLAGVIWQILFGMLVYSKYQEELFYPLHAITYLKKHPFAGELFAEYDWGGYLIWKYPEKNVFVDGRMPTWFLDHPSPHESSNAFKEYAAFFSGKLPFYQLANKYHITTVLLKNTKQYKGPLHLSEQMEKTGFRMVYKDTVAVIYQTGR